jgi:hypothetical protein
MNLARRTVNSFPPSHESRREDGQCAPASHESRREDGQCAPASHESRREHGGCVPASQESRREEYVFRYCRRSAEACDLLSRSGSPRPASTWDRAIRSAIPRIVSVHSSGAREGSIDRGLRAGVTSASDRPPSPFPPALCRRIRHVLRVHPYFLYALRAGRMYATGSRPDTRRGQRAGSLVSHGGL